MKLQVLYGGELSQSVSENFSELAAADSHEVTVFDMKDFKKAKLDTEESFTVFIIQTIENDQVPESAIRMFSYLKNLSHPGDMLSKLNFAVVGLGDSNLLQDRQTTTAKDCNHCGQIINKRLKDLGGTMMHELCMADERNELAEVDPWMTSFFKSLPK
jgi:sulfite reductase alpha subunit-like flavoprotein